MNILRSILGLDEKPLASKQAEAPSEPTKPSSEQTGRVSDALRPLLAFMEGMKESLATKRVEQLTLRDAITRFVEDRPQRDEPVKGALIIQPHREGKLVLWAFLDSNNGLIRGADGKPLGSKAICGSLDQELTDILGERELLIVE